MQARALKFDIPRYLPINQLEGPQILLPQLVLAVDFQNATDYLDWISRMTSFPIYIDNMIAWMRKGMGNNIVLSTDIANKTIYQIANFIYFNESSVFFQPFLALNRSDPLVEKGRNAANNVTSSLAKLYNFILKEYIPKTRISFSLSDFPGGTEYYNFLVEYYTTTKKHIISDS